MLENHFYKRKIDVQALDPQKATASGKNVIQMIKLKDGLDSDTAKKLIKPLKKVVLKRNLPSKETKSVSQIKSAIHCNRS